MPRRRKGKEPENQERWLITYSDLITLLMIFFVIMYAMSTINQTKFVSLSQSLKTALKQADKIPLDGQGQTSLILSSANDDSNKLKTTSSTLNETQKDQQVLDNLYQKVQAYIKSHNLTQNVSAQEQARGVQITLKDIVLFDTGQAVIKPQAQQLLSGLIPFFRQLPNSIVVEGYTDDQPINTALYPSNWELSAARAMGVVRFIAGQGVAPDRLSGIGYGQYHGVAANDTPGHRQENRRVNIVILRQGIAPGTYSSEAPPTDIASSQAVTALSSFANTTSGN